MSEFKYEWTPERAPRPSVSRYNHTQLMSPIGDFIIEWKIWKEHPSYNVILRDDTWIGESNSLDGAKSIVRQYLDTKRNELVEFLNQQQ